MTATARPLALVSKSIDCLTDQATSVMESLLALMKQEKVHGHGKVELFINKVFRSQLLIDIYIIARATSKTLPSASYM